jgi:acyl-CoA thioesterase
MTDFTSLSTPTRREPGVFQIDVPDGWQQGRGAFGGLVLAHLVRAIEAFDDSADAGRRLRSLTAEICGPVPTGVSALHVERLRTGTGVSTLAARIVRDGEVLAHAVGVLGRPRAEGTDFTALPDPPMPPWRAVPETLPIDRSFGPAFAQYLEFRPVVGQPFSGGPEAVASGWVRFKDPGPARDAAHVTAMSDAWWPALFTRLTTPRPVATIAFTLELLDGTEGLDPAAPYFHSARSIASRGGYMVELRELRGEDGRLLSLNQQTLTIIK